MIQWKILILGWHASQRKTSKMIEFFENKDDEIKMSYEMSDDTDKNSNQ